MTVEYLGRKNLVKMKNSKYVNIPAGIFDNIDFVDVFFDKTENAVIILPADIPKAPFDAQGVTPRSVVGVRKKKEVEVQQR